MALNRDEELKRIKEWVEERRRKMEEDVTLDDNNTIEPTNDARSPVASNIKLPKGYYKWPVDIRKRWTTGI